MEKKAAPQALAGVKVIAFVQGITGPMTASMLASYGAEVVRIESATRIEWHRQAGPFIGGQPNPDKSVPYLFINAGQRGITLNLKKPRSREVMERIIKWADILVENFSGGTMVSIGLGYEDLKKIRPDIIMLSAGIYGQTGPMAQARGYGGTLTALTGMPSITGFPDQPPQFPGFAITDFIAPRANVLALVGALDYRRRTGKGQYLDAAQAESAFPLLTPTYLQYQANGREPARIGNRCEYAAPHGVYRCKGDNQWCAVTVFTDDEWQAFGKALGQPAWTRAPEYATVLGRLGAVDKLDRQVEEWTLQHSPQEVMDLLQKAGVAAGVVQGGRELDEDPQLKHRGLHWKLEQPEIGSFTYTGQPIKMSRTPYEMKRSPRLGEDNEYFYTRVLGYNDEQFVELLADGVFE